MRGPGDNGKTDCRCHRKEKHGVALVQCQSVAVAERKRLSEITGTVCQGGRREASAGELEKPHHQLVDTYTSLNRQYAELQSEYKHLRRYFGVTAQVPYTDVWTHKPVQFYPGKHPCEKPAEMLQQIISASSRPGDLVADFFMGSGSTVKAALALGRRAIGVELETGRFEQTVREVQDLIV